jgi:ABC-2 type transport system ATP-binding protein
MKSLIGTQGLLSQRATMLSVQNLYYHYPNRLALTDISFTTPRYGLIGILGENGAGKSTLIKLLCGILAPEQGQILLDGQRVCVEGESRQQIGYLSERNPIYEDMNVVEYLNWIQGFKGGSVKAILEELQLEKVQHQRIKTLSKGFKQRVGIAQALINQPKLLILDEPMVGLDPIQIQAFQALVLQLKSKLLLMVSTHQLSEIMGLADELLLMHQGRLVKYESLAVFAQALDQRMVDFKISLSAENQLNTALKGYEYQLYPLSQPMSKANFNLSIHIDEEEIPRVLQLLLAQNCLVYEIKSKKKQLEDIFSHFVSSADQP